MLSLDLQNKRRSCHEKILGNEKLLGYVEEEIKTCLNKFKVRVTLFDGMEE